ncbi:MAG: hypothetical protein JWQ38_3442 [Flavipsychrobacter sp.]|nr:hypothetical protein [Flavipsychrobacter sp.]
MKYLAYFAIAAVLLTSCGKKSEDVICKSGIINLLAAGFTHDDYQHARIYRYYRSGASDTLVAEYTLSYTYYTGDTSLILFGEEMVQQGYSYVISFPAANTSFYLTDFTPSGQTHKIFTYTKAFSHPPFECYNAIMACTINGVQQLSQAIPHEERTRVLYIQKP